MSGTPKEVVDALTRATIELHGVTIHPLSVAHEIAFEKAGCAFGRGEPTAEKAMKAVYLSTFPATEVLAAQRKMNDADFDRFVARLPLNAGNELVSAFVEILKNADAVSVGDPNDVKANPSPATGG